MAEAFLRAAAAAGATKLPTELASIVELERAHGREALLERPHRHGRQAGQVRSRRPGPADPPYGLDLQDLLDKTLNEISYSGSFRHLTADDRRSEPGRLWTTNADLISLEQAQAPHEAEVLLPVHAQGVANALALWFSAELAPDITLSVGPGDPPTHWGMTTAPLRSPVELMPGMVVRARVRTAPARPVGTWTSWAIAMPGADWEEHDEQTIWVEVDD